MIWYRKVYTMNREKIYNKLYREALVSCSWAIPFDEISRTANIYAVKNTDKEFYKQGEEVLTEYEKLEREYVDAIDLLVGAQKDTDNLLGLCSFKDTQIEVLVKHLAESIDETTKSEESRDKLQQDNMDLQYYMKNNTFPSEEDYKTRILALEAEVRILNDTIDYEVSLSKTDCSDYKTKVEYLERTLSFAEVAIKLSEDAVNESVTMMTKAEAELKAHLVISEITDKALASCEGALASSQKEVAGLRPCIWSNAE